jgi:hypothetical protein
MSAIITEEGLDVSQVEMILGKAALRPNGLNLKITKFGNCYTAPCFVKIQESQINVQKDRNLSVIEDVETQRKYRPANEFHESLFSQWLDQALRGQENGSDYGQPIEVCFDQI